MTDTYTRHGRVIAGAFIVGLAASVTLVIGLTGGQGADDPAIHHACSAAVDLPPLPSGRPLTSTIFVERGGAEGVSPQNQISNFPVVAHVKTAKEALDKCATLDSSDSSRVIVSTVLDADVVEYFKGHEPDYLQLDVWGGTADGYTTEIRGMLSSADFPPGSEGVVYLSEGRDGTWLVENAYVFNGSVARSELDDRELPVVDLLTQLREAAGADAAIE